MSDPIKPQPTRPGLYITDGNDREWITEDTSVVAWNAVVATMTAAVRMNRLAIFSRPRIVVIRADGQEIKGSRDLSIPE